MLGRRDAVQGEINSCLKRRLLLRGVTAVSRSVLFPETTGTGCCIAEKQNVSTCLSLGLSQPGASARLSLAVVKALSNGATANPAAVLRCACTWELLHLPCIVDVSGGGVLALFSI